MQSIYKKGDSTKLSPHFRAREFDCRGVGCCKQTQVDMQLVAYLQTIRDHFGKPVFIESGYRCAAHNASIPNAAPKSKHMDGLAVDIVVDGVRPLEVARYAETIGVKGIGLYDDFVHIDTREAKAFWYSHAQAHRDTFGGGYTLAQFVREVQSLIGAKVDGVAGAETLGKTVTVSAYINCTHPLVRCVQKRLYALGYTQVGEADGIAGCKFQAAVIAFQKANGCWVDGEVTAKNKTWRKLLGMA